MTNALSTLTPGRGVAPVSRATADLTSVMHNRLEPIPGNFRRCALSAGHEPSPEQRAALVERRNHLEDALAPCDEATVRRAVGMLRSVMAVAAVDEPTQKLQRQAYLVTLTPYPAWAVEAACRQYLDGSKGEGIHAPKPGEIATVCRQLVAGAQEERARINAILDAEIYQPPTDAEREMVAQRFKQFAAETASLSKADDGRVTPAGSDAAEREKAKDHLAELAARQARRLSEESQRRDEGERAA